MSERQQDKKCVLPLKKHGTHRNEEDKGVGSSRQGRQKSGSSFRSNFEHSGYKPEPSQLQKTDGKEGIRDVQGVPQVKHTLNTIQQKTMKLPNESRIQVTMQRGRKPLEGEVGQNTQDKTLESWFKVTVPNGMKYDKIWLINLIVNHCSVPFTPVDFHYANNRAQFFVQGASTASALKDINGKIFDEENQKILIFVNASVVPYSMRDKLEPKKMEQLKLTMNKRYDHSKKALDLQNLRYDPDLVGLDIDIMLNRRNCMAATLQIIKENFPELLSLNLCNNKLCQLSGLSDIVQMAPTVKILNLSKNQLEFPEELVKIKGLHLQELWLEGNLLCGNFQDQSTYISAIRNYFPKLSCLDGHMLPPPIIVDVDRPYLPKPCKESYEVTEALKNLVKQFLQQYYFIYDFGDRQGLLAAYHDEACFSLTIPYKPEDPAPSSLCAYFEDNRNMKSLRDPFLRVELLKHTKRDIVCCLCVLPKTQHDLSSFVVDMWLQTEGMLCFSVSGVFKEVEEKCQGFLRVFSRTFIAIPASNSGVCILNDELFVRDATPNKTQSAFSSRAPTTISSSGRTLSQKQQKVVPAVSTQSAISFQCPQK